MNIVIFLAPALPLHFNIYMLCYKVCTNIDQIYCSVKHCLFRAIDQTGLLLVCWHRCCWWRANDAALLDVIGVCRCTIDSLVQWNEVNISILHFSEQQTVRSLTVYFHRLGPMLLRMANTTTTSIKHTTFYVLMVFC